MKDSQVDLCGELGHADSEDTFPVLQPEDTFSFACNGCGDCCRGREDIVLSGYDLWRICARLRLPPPLVIRTFCRQYTGTGSHMPVVRLRPLHNEKNNCPFLYRGKCSIHEAEPLVCALYPLGQQIERDGTVCYFVQPIDCGGPVHSAVTADYLDRYGVRAREPIDVSWAQNCIRLSHTARELEKSLPPVQMKLVQRRILRALYLDYEYDRPFAPQWEDNLARLDRELAHIARQKSLTIAEHE